MTSSVKRIGGVLKKHSDKQRTFSWLNPKCEVRDTGMYGKGVFAKSVIRKGEIVCVAGGYIPMSLG